MGWNDGRNGSAHRAPSAHSSREVGGLKQLAQPLGEGRYDQILKCSERSTQQIRYRPTGPQAPWDRIRANADNRKASRISLFVSKTVAGEPQGEDATVLLINIYRTSVSGVLRRKDSGLRFVAKTWPAFRDLWRESGKQDAAVALQKRAPANEPEGNPCLAARRRVRRAQQPERSVALLSYRSGRREPQRSVPEGVRTA